MAWIKLAEQDQLADGEMIGLKAGGVAVALYRDGGEYFATSNICTHQYALLTDGYFEDGCIECPLHQGSFDIRTGRALCAPVTEDVQVFPVKIEGGQVFVEIA